MERRRGEQVSRARREEEETMLGGVVW